MIIILAITDDGRTIICDIYEKHYKRMLYTATRILGRESGEEAVHDIFVRLIDQLGKNPVILSGKPSQYFVIIVRNHSINLLKKERLVLLPFEEEIMDSGALHTLALTPENALLNDEAVDMLAARIRSLTPAMRQALELRYIEGYSNTEIAEMLGVSQSAVSTSIEKARKRLKNMLRDEDANETA